MKKKKRAFRDKGFWAVLFLLVLAVLAAAVIRDWRSREIKDAAYRDGPSGKKSRNAGEKAASGRKARWIAVIVDDIGYDLSRVDELLQIDAPLTFAILPHCTFSTEAAERLHKAGKEILLHLPMEPRGPGKNPGKGVLLTGMSGEEITAVLEEDLRSVPHAIGVNNHMGSKFMEDRQKLKAVFRTLGGKGLFFVDSMTTGHSQGRSLAEETGIPFAARDIFIDNKGDFGNTRKEFVKLIQAHGHRSRLIVIGHPYPGTVSAIRESVERLRSGGVEIVPVSKLLKK